MKPVMQLPDIVSRLILLEYLWNIKFIILTYSIDTLWTQGFMKNTALSLQFGF